MAKIAWCAWPFSYTIVLLDDGKQLKINFVKHAEIWGPGRINQMEARDADLGALWMLAVGRRVFQRSWEIKVMLNSLSFFFLFVCLDISGEIRSKRRLMDVCDFPVDVCQLIFRVSLGGSAPGMRSLAGPSQGPWAYCLWLTEPC